MRLKFLFILFSVISLVVSAQTKSNSDARSNSDKTESEWNKQISEISQSQLIVLADGISYNANADGILLNLAKPTNNVKLFALTGEIYWSGNLVQGRFFIPARPGIYFLRINNKSYKVVCK